MKLPDVDMKDDEVHATVRYRSRQDFRVEFDIGEDIRWDEGGELVIAEDHSLRKEEIAYLRGVLEERLEPPVGYESGEWITHPWTTNPRYELEKGDILVDEDGLRYLRNNNPDALMAANEVTASANWVKAETLGDLPGCYVAVIKTGGS
jgi:hypothetical protein